VVVAATVVVVVVVVATVVVVVVVVVVVAEEWVSEVPVSAPSPPRERSNRRGTMAFLYPFFPDGTSA
jgi:hypothetical protein